MFNIHNGDVEHKVKCFTSMYDLSSDFYIEIYTSQLPDMVFEFLIIENL